MAGDRLRSATTVGADLLSHAFDISYLWALLREFIFPVLAAAFVAFLIAGLGLFVAVPISVTLVIADVFG